MPRRPCSICLRPDVEELDELLKNGVSARQIALRRDIHPRLMSEHFRRHRNGLAGNLKRLARSKANLARLTENFTVAGETKALIGKVSTVLVSAEKSGSHNLLLSAVREARGLLDLLGRTTGELASPGVTTVNVALGVTLERGKQAVEIVTEAEQLSESEIADRAVECLRMWNEGHPEDMRLVGPPARLGAHADGTGSEETG